MLLVPFFLYLCSLGVFHCSAYNSIILFITDCCCCFGKCKELQVKGKGCCYSVFVTSGVLIPRLSDADIFHALQLLKQTHTLPFGICLRCTRHSTHSKANLQQFKLSEETDVEYEQNMSSYGGDWAKWMGKQRDLNP